MKWIFTILMVLVACSAPAQEVDVGLIVPLTGAASFYGQSYTQGMELAIQERNLPLTLHIQDSKLSGKEAVSAVHYLENAVNPDVYSVVFALPASAAGPVIEEAGKTMVYEAYSRDIAQENTHSFKANFDAQQGCKDVITHLQKNKPYEQLGVMFAKAPYSEECLKGIQAVEDDVATFWYTFGETDFRTLLLKTEKEGVDRLMIMGIEFEYVNIFQQLSEKTYSFDIVCATTSECITPNVEAVATEDALQGTVSVDFVSRDVLNSVFAINYRETHSQATDAELIAAAAGYEQALLVGKAAETCQEAHCFGEALSEVKEYNSVIGTAGFKNRMLQTQSFIYEWDGGWR